MGFYVITEIVEVKDGVAFTTSNNHVKEKNEAFEMFIMRSEMLMNTPNVKVLKASVSKEEDWGFVKVELENGNTVEIGISLFTLI